MQALKIKVSGTQQTQQGSALIISLVLLIALSLLGLSSANNSVIEEKMSANSQLKTTLYQSAKSEGYAQLAELNDNISPFEKVRNKERVVLDDVLSHGKNAADSELNFTRIGKYIARSPQGINSDGRALYSELSTTTRLGNTGAVSEQTIGISFRLPDGL